MITTNIDLMSAIAELRLIFPEWRMGQLMANLVLAADIEGEFALWDIEDEQLLAAARRLIEQNGARRSVAAAS